MFTVDSFGWNCPENWEEICDALNSIAEEELGDEEDDDLRREIINSIWERFCAGQLEGVPEGRNYNDDEKGGITMTTMTMTREQMWEEIRKELAEVSAQCVAEGYPSHGSNYDLRAQSVYDWYQEAYPDLWEDYPPATGER